MFVQRESDEVVRQYGVGDGWQCSEVLRSTQLGKELIRCKPVYDGDQIGKFVARLPSNFSAVKTMFKKHQGDIKKDLEFKRCFSEWVSYVRNIEESGLCLPLYSTQQVSGLMLAYDPSYCYGEEDVADMVVNVDCEGVSTCFVGSKVSDLRLFVRYTFGMLMFNLIGSGRELVDGLDLREYGIFEGGVVSVIRGKFPEPVYVQFGDQRTSFFGSKASELYTFVMSRFGIFDSFWITRGTSIIKERGFLNDYGVAPGDMLNVHLGVLIGGTDDSSTAGKVLLSVSGSKVKVARLDLAGNPIVADEVEMKSIDDDPYSELAKLMKQMYEGEISWDEVLAAYKKIDERVAQNYSCYPVNVEMLNDVMSEVYMSMKIPVATNLFRLKSYVSGVSLTDIRQNKCVYRYSFEGPEYILIIWKSKCYLYDRSCVLHFVLNGKVDESPFVVAYCQVVINSRTGEYGCMITDVLYCGADLREKDILVREQYMFRIRKILRPTINVSVMSRNWKFVSVADYLAIKQELPVTDIVTDGYVFVPHYVPCKVEFVYKTVPIVITSLVILGRATSIPCLMARDDLDPTNAVGMIQFGYGKGKELMWMDGFTVQLQWNPRVKGWCYIRPAPFGAQSDNISTINNIKECIDSPILNLDVLFKRLRK